MRNRPAHEDVKDILETKLETFKLRIKVAKSEKSSAISLEGLEIALKPLKVVKSRDPDSWIHDIFK